MPPTTMLILSDSLWVSFSTYATVSICLKHTYTSYTMTCLSYNYMITADNLVSDC